MVVTAAPAPALRARPVRPAAAAPPGAGAPVAVLRRPSLLAAAAVLLVPLPGGGAGASVADAVSFLLAAVALTGAALGDRRPLAPRGAALLAAVVVALALATVASTDPATSVTGFVRGAQLLVLVPLAVAVAVRDRLDLALVCGAVVVTGVAQGAVGVYQAVTGTGASIGGEGVRAVGTFGAVNIMAMAVVVSCACVVALGLGLAAGGRTRVVLLLTAVALLVPLALSLSRGSWIATAAAAAAVLVVHDVRLAVLTAIAGVALTTAVVGGTGVGADALGERLGSITSSTTRPDQSVADRYHLWAAAEGAWRDHPVTGVGPRRFPAHRDSHASIGLSSGSDTDDPANGYQRVELRSPHNQYLLVLSEQGLLGLTAFAGLLGALLVGAVRAARAAPPAARGAALVAVGVLVLHLTEFVYGDLAGPTGVLTAVLLGIAVRVALLRGPTAGVPR